MNSGGMSTIGSGLWGQQGQQGQLIPHTATYVTQHEQFWQNQIMRAMTEPAHNIRVIEAENGYILEYTPKAGGSMKKYVCIGVEDLRDRITACMVGDKLEGPK